MSDTVYTKRNRDGAYHRVTILDNVDKEHIDQILDVISPNNGNVFVTKEEFDSAYDKTITLDIMDENSEFIIGEIETKWFDMESEEADGKVI